jgi:hypothetical protein
MESIILWVVALASITIAFIAMNRMSEQMIKAHREILWDAILAVKSSSLSEYKWEVSDEPLPVSWWDDIVEVTEADPDMLIKYLKTVRGEE